MSCFVWHMQESLHLQAKIDKQSGSLEALQGLLRPMQAENKSIVKVVQNWPSHMVVHVHAGRFKLVVYTECFI